METDSQTHKVHLRADSPKDPQCIALKSEKSHVEITVDSGVRGIVFDTSSSDTHAIHVNLGPESMLHIVSLSTDSARTCRAELGEGAHVHWHCFTLGSSPSSHTLISTLNGRNARSDIDWVFSVRDSEKQSVSVRNVFAAESGAGEIAMKGVAEGMASATCNGMIEITEAGGGTDTYLTEDVLMLDPTAKIDAVPALEIRTNDVKASHSATVSRVTAEDLFYFQSRGIPPSEARRMYTEGFLSDLTDRIPDEEIRLQVRAALLHQ